MFDPEELSRLIEGLKKLREESGMSRSGCQLPLPIERRRATINDDDHPDPRTILVTSRRF